MLFGCVGQGRRLRASLAEALTARVTWATMSVAERHHPLVEALIAADLATIEEVDALFAAGAAIP